jgi:hypothetical protein
VKKVRGKALASSRRSVSKRRAGRMVLGRVSGANSGRVTVSLQRYKKGRWSKARVLRTTVDSSGVFSKSLKVKRGKWRVRASYNGAGSPCTGFVRFKS